MIHKSVTTSLSRSLSLSVPALAGLLVLPAAAQQATNAPATRLPEVVITASRFAEEIGKSSLNATIVTRAEIEQRQSQTVADVLRGEQGVIVNQTGQPGGNTSVFLRGGNGSHTLVLIDGVRVNRPYDNTFNFADLPVDSVERIEILRGPQSTIYGSEALGGVINIITKQGVGQPTGSAMVEGGSFQSWRTRESFSVKSGMFSAAADGSYFTTDNSRSNSAYDALNGSVRLGLQPAEQFSASFLANFLSSRAGVPNDRFTDDPNDRFQTDSQLYALTLAGRPIDWWDVKLTLSHGRERNRFNQPPPNPPFFGGDYANEVRSDRNQADLQNTFTLADGHRLLVGGTYDASSAHQVDPFTDFRATVISRASFAQYEFAPHERFTATVGGRVDSHSSYGTQPTWKFGARHTVPVTETIIRANVGTSFRSPSITELYYPVFGNPALRPEQAIGWDAGVEQPLLGNKVKLGVTYFQNEFKDLINGFPPVNVQRARTLGLENFATWTPVPELSLRLSYTWLAAEDRTTGLRLDRRAEHSGSFNVNYAFLKKFNANTAVKRVGPRPDQNFSTFPATRVTNPGYVKWDLGLSYNVCKNFSVHGRLDNVLDARYEEVFGFPSLGRTFWLGGTARF